MKPSDQISGSRLWTRLMDFARYGGREDGGVDRQTLTATEIVARRQLMDWGKELGLRPFTDGAANLFLRFEGAQSDLAPVLTGSHIDSQPTGGRFDGVLGVLAGLEAVRAIKEAGLCPQRPIEIVAWTNEEGSRFAPGMSGSDVFTGTRQLETVYKDRDSDGVSFEDAVNAVLSADVDVPRRAFRLPVAAFVELHIEQGPILERAGTTIGVVTGIQGTRRYRVRVSGEAAHAGTAERAERKDALLAAARMINAMDQAASATAGVKFTVGMLNVKPNAPSVVPEEAFFSIDLRHPDNAVVDRLDGAFREIVEREAVPCKVELKQIQHSPSLEFDRRVRSVVAEVSAALGISNQDIYSAAGHDARQLHYVCPTGMIFVPCRDGISHNPAEWCEPNDVAAGARVLADVVWKLANQS